MRIQLPELSLILLIGPSGCGKSSFSRKHFLPTEIISSDVCRGLVADDENDQSATGDAFDLVHTIARKRLARGRLTVIDATNVQPKSRKPLVELAREYHVLPVAIVFDLPEKLCHERNASRPDRQLVRTACVIKRNRCAAPCEAWNARDSAIFFDSHPQKRWIAPASSVSRSGTTSAMST